MSVKPAPAQRRVRGYGSRALLATREGSPVRPVLLVEDGVYYYDTLRWTLRRSGYTVDCVSGAQEALDYLAAAGSAGLVVLHCRKPDCALLGRLKRSGAAVVVVTEQGPNPEAADYVLPAPASEEKLLAVARGYYRDGAV